MEQNDEGDALPIANNSVQILSLIKTEKPFDIAVDYLLLNKNIPTFSTYLSDAVKRSTTLKRLILYNRGNTDGFSEEYWKRLVDAVLVNKSIEEFSLLNIVFSVHWYRIKSLCKILQDLNDSMTRVISNGSATLPSLKKLSIKGGRISDTFLNELLAALKHNKAIRQLDLRSMNELEIDQMTAVLRELRDNDTITQLDMICGIMTDESGLLEFIKQNRSVKKLKFYSCLFSEGYWHAIEEAVKENGVISELTTSAKITSTSDVPDTLKNMLMHNKEVRMEMKRNMKILVRMIVMKPQSYFDGFPPEIWNEILRHIQLPGEKSFGNKLISLLNKRIIK